MKMFEYQELKMPKKSIFFNFPERACFHFDIEENLEECCGYVATLVFSHFDFEPKEMWTMLLFINMASVLPK